MKSIEAKVGVFILASAAILAVTVFFVSKAGLRGEQVPYRMYLHYAGGVEAGSSVLFGGIKVGKVTSVHPDRTDPTRIEILLAMKPGTPVNAACVGKLGSVNLLGNPVVSITTGSNASPRLPAGSVIPSQETVSMDDMQRKIAALSDTAQGTLASVRVDVDSLTSDARQVLANVNALTGRANQKHVARLLANADSMSKQVSSKIGPTLDNVNTTVANANGTITAIRDPLKADLLELHRTLEQYHSLGGNFQAILSTNSDNITYSLENIRMLTDNLNDLTQSVKERPWSLVRIRQPEDRKVPQEKSK